MTISRWHHSGLFRWVTSCQVVFRFAFVCSFCFIFFFSFILTIDACVTWESITYLLGISCLLFFHIIVIVGLIFFRCNIRLSYGFSLARSLSLSRVGISKITARAILYNTINSVFTTKSLQDFFFVHLLLIFVSLNTVSPTQKLQSAVSPFQRR